MRRGCSVLKDVTRRQGVAVCPRQGAREDGRVTFSGVNNNYRRFSTPGIRGETADPRCLARSVDLSVWVIRRDGPQLKRNYRNWEDLDVRSNWSVSVKRYRATVSIAGRSAGLEGWNRGLSTAMSWPRFQWIESLELDQDSSAILLPDCLQLTP